MSRRFALTWRALVWVGAGALLFLPAASRPAGRFGAYLFDLPHVPLFFAVAATLPRRWRYPVALAGAAGLVLLAEALQPFAGREAEARDVLLGLAGSLLALSFRPDGGGRPVRLAVAAAALFPLILVGMDRYEARRSFPLLASFRAPMEAGRWQARGCRLERARDERGWFGRMKAARAGQYPGVFLVEAPRDWSRMSEMRLTLFWTGAETKTFWIRADDRGGQPPYAERLQKAFDLTPGLHVLRITRAEWSATPSGRPFDWTRVLSLGLFFDWAGRGEEMEILEIRLLPADVRGRPTPNES